MIVSLHLGSARTICKVTIVAIRAIDPTAAQTNERPVHTKETIALFLALSGSADPVVVDYSNIS